MSRVYDKRRKALKKENGIPRKRRGYWEIKQIVKYWYSRSRTGGKIRHASTVMGLQWFGL
jgi:hypothetical protein